MRSMETLSAGDEGLIDLENQFEEEALVADESQLQADVPDLEARNLSRSLKRFYRTFFVNSTAHDWRFIKAVPGSRDPPARRDFTSVPDGANAMDVSSLAGSILVATEDDTSFYGFGWGNQVALRSNCKLIEMSKGDILLYRGDFILAPVAYETSNLCLHAYLDTPFTERSASHHHTSFRSSTTFVSLWIRFASFGSVLSGEPRLRSVAN
ncbi:unnamed protein product [Phytophthora lilii]|uniref:Unnamed protein product n=1 Tax=Phytophthora lilii TaxID=2077276 RepID=A0A9W6WYR1_9STRA|nr:unnamed protein product [Phytophthora lilii]